MSAPLTRLNYTIEAATLDDVGLVKTIANRYRDELGQVMWPALREAVARGELTVARSSAGSPLGFVNWHARRDGWHTIYEIAVAPSLTRSGIGRALINSIPRPTRLKCTQDNARANAFYAAVGFSLARTEPGKNRSLNVWERT